MDLIGALSSQLGIDSSKAEALAGGVLGAVRGQVAENASPEAAQQIDSAVPQLGGWMQTAQSMLGGDEAEAAPAAESGLGGMLGGMLGGGGQPTPEMIEQAKAAAASGQMPKGLPGLGAGGGLPKGLPGLGGGLPGLGSGLPALSGGRTPKKKKKR